jgi:ACS family allantoate permease-like MFS transporter
LSNPQGLQFDTKLKGDQYGWLGSIFSLGLLVGQYPMCFLQQRLPLSKFTAFNIIVWGVAVSCTAVCHNFKQLMACRL